MTAGSSDGKLTPDCVGDPTRVVLNPGRAGMGTAFIPTPEPQMPIVLLCGEEWQGLYVDGEMMGQGHSLSASDVMAALRAKGFLVCWGDVNEEWLLETGFLPKSIEDVQWNSKT